MRRRLVPIALVALLVLAGCSAPLETDLGASTRPDPDSDVQGWEQGYWHNDTLAVTESDGLNSSERTAVIRRAMARVEYIRDVEFDEEVTVDLLSREEYRNQSGGGGSGRSEAFRTFDNAKFEALFLVGEREDSIDTQDANRGSTVLGFYSPSQDRIVIIADTQTPTLSETTLAHELVHAYQFRHFDPSYNRSTRELYNARNGLIEGDARWVDLRYRERCGDEWECSKPSSSGGGSGDGDAPSIHWGIYALNYFPYSDGPGLIEHVRESGGWDAVADLYDAPPNSTEQVALPTRYGTDEPRDVPVEDRTGAEWERVRPPNRIDYAVLGQSGIASMFGYTIWAERGDPVVAQDQFLNVGPTGVDRSDPFNYSVDYARGWDGDRMHVYTDGQEMGYVWKSVWDDADEASEFAAGYRELLRYWGGERVEDGVWRIPEGESEFADAFRVTVTGDTVTIVNAPTVDELDGVHAAA